MTKTPTPQTTQQVSFGNVLTKSLMAFVDRSLLDFFSLAINALLGFMILPPGESHTIGFLIPAMTL
jgi:hypothetical protein